MTTLVPCVSVKAGCFWRRMLTHLHLDDFIRPAKWVSKADTQSLQLHGWLRKTASSVCPNSCLHQQLHVTACLSASTVKKTLRPSENQSTRYVEYEVTFSLWSWDLPPHCLLWKGIWNSRPCATLRWDHFNTVKAATVVNRLIVSLLVELASFLCFFSVWHY